MDSMIESAEHDAAVPPLEWSGGPGGGADGRRRPGPRGDRRVQRRGHRRRVPRRRLRRSDRGHPPLPGRVCPATAAGSGPSWSRHIRAPTTPPSAKSSWCRARRRCWRRSGCPGMSGSSPAISSPGDLLAPVADDPRLVPGYMSTGDPQIDEVAAEVGLRPSAGAQPVGPQRRRAALARRRLRSWLGDGPGDPAGLPRLRLLPAAGRIARDDVRGVRQRDVAPTGTWSTPSTAAARTRTPRRRRAPGRRCTTRTTTACSTWWRAPTGYRFSAAALMRVSDAFIPSTSSSSKLGHAAQQRVDQEVRHRLDAVLGVPVSISRVPASVGSSS